MAGEFPSDQQVHAEVDRFAEAANRYGTSFFSGFSLILDFGNLFERAPSEEDARGPLEASCQTLLNYDPEPLYVMAESLHRCVGPIDDSRPEAGDFHEGYRAAQFQLSGWKGAGADAFREHLVTMELFARVQTGHMVKAGGHLVAAFELLRSARADTVAMLNAGIDGLRDMAATKRRQEIFANITAGAALVNGVANLASSSSSQLLNALKAGSGGVAAVGAVSAIRLTGSNPRELMESVHAEHVALARTVEDALDDLIPAVHEVHGSVLENIGRNAEGPLPSSTDIRDPSFAYDTFASPWRPPDDFRPEVEEARERGRIGRALNPPPPG